MAKAYKDYKVLVCGAGTMGASIAQVFAASGIKVVVTDLKQEFVDNGLGHIDSAINDMVANGLADESYRETVKANLSTTTNDKVPAMAKDFDVVYEVIIENKDAKRSLFQMLVDNCRPDCIFASNTSGMDVFSVTDDIMTNPGRLVITHWFNPPYLMKIIEVVKGPKTSDETAETMRGLLEFCGKKPAVLNKFMPGFIVNRLATVICRELYSMVEKGWVNAQDAENALKYTDGLRWSFEGPLELWDFVGLGLTCTVAKDVLPTLCNDSVTIPYGDKLIAEGKTGVKDGEGCLKSYEGVDFDAYVKKRNRRIIEMYKMMNKFEEEDAAE